MTAGIMYAVKLTYKGVHSMEFMPDSKLLRFFAATTISTVQIFSGTLGGRYNMSLHIQSHNSPVGYFGWRFSVVVVKISKKNVQV